VLPLFGPLSWARDWRTLLRCIVGFVAAFQLDPRANLFLAPRPPTHTGPYPWI
jgi:hypothetical protein